MREKLEKIIKAYEELQAKMTDPSVIANQKEYNRLAKEYAGRPKRSSSWQGFRRRLKPCRS